MKKIISLTLIICLISCLQCLSQNKKKIKQTGLNFGDLAPELMYKNINDKTMKLSSLKGKNSINRIFGLAGVGRVEKKILIL